MEIFDYLTNPEKNEFKDWSPVATKYRFYFNNTNQSTRIYENNGNLYIKLPNSDWKRIIQSVSCKVDTKVGTYETEIDVFPPIIKEDESDS